MKVYLLKDIEKVGLAGEVLNVKDGFAANFLFPKKLAIRVTPENETLYAKQAKKVEKRKEVVATKTSMLAEKIKGTTLTLARKIHDDSRLYGSISEGEVVDALAQQGISVSKSQVLFEKSIKEKGTYKVTIKLSSALQPQITLKVVAEIEASATV